MGSYKFVAENSIKKYHKSDVFLFASIILLFGIGMFTLFSSTQDYSEKFLGNSLSIVRRQFICSLVGFAGLLFFWIVNMNFIRKCLPFFVIGVLILCILTFIPALSIERNGARRWIRLPFNFSLQSSEFVKFVIVLFIANLFDKQLKIQNPEDKNIFP